MKKIKLLYYSKALTSNHGGRFHSEAFLKESKKNLRVKQVYSFPTFKNYKVKEVDYKKNNSLKQFLKNNSLFQVLFFLRMNYISYKEIVPVILSTNPDCVHIRTTRNFLVIKPLKKKFPGILFTTEVNASPFDESFKNISFKKYFRKLEYKSLSQADANFFVSSYLKDKIMFQPLDDRDFVVHNGVDLELFKPLKKDSTKNQIVFGYIGTLDYHKKLTSLIDALEIVVKANINVKIQLLIVGDGPMAIDLKDYVFKKGLDRFVEFSGWVEHKEIPRYLEQMDIAIHHSANPYMSPLKIFEYMAVGLPVIGPDIPSLNEIFQDKNEILLVKNNDGDLSKKMIYLLNNKLIREELAFNGQKKIRNEYGWSNNAEKILKIIQNKNSDKNA